MERVRVQSESLKSVGYDAMTSTLEVQFRNGGIFQYFYVPHFIFSRLLETAAKANYFQNRVRHQFKFRRLS